MPWLRLQKDILEDFQEEHHRIERRSATEERGLESCRRGWRERQLARGLCRSCRRPIVRESKHYCHVHLEANKARARAASRRNHVRKS